MFILKLAILGLLLGCTAAVCVFSGKQDAREQNI